MADAVQSELEKYKQSEEEVKRLKDAMVSENLAEKLSLLHCLQLMEPTYIVYNM